VQVAGADATTQLDGKLLFDRLLEPTRIYVKSMLALAEAMPVHGFAHITGGGITDNVPRVLPDGIEAVLQRKAWAPNPLFDWLAAAGNIDAQEMYRTFNCGIGMIAVVAADKADAALALLRARSEDASLIGEIRKGDRGCVIEG